MSVHWWLCVPVAVLICLLVGWIILAWYWSGRRFSRSWLDPLWWFAGYHGLYQVDWWLQYRGVRRWWLRGVA